MTLRHVSQTTRREFLGQSAVVGGALSAPLFIPAAVLGRDGTAGANDHIRVGVIGSGFRANQLMQQLPEPGRIVAISDCNLKRAEGAAKSREGCKAYQNYREMLDKEQLDGVIVGTPDHGRTLPCILAMQAGLDIYAEKPLTAYVKEGRILVDWARKLERVFQVGSQQRTMEINEYCCRQVREGKIGTVKKVLGVNYPGPANMPELAGQAIPEKNDWNEWLGPAPERPFHEDLQFKWMFWRDYSGGQVTNWGAHGIDQIQWALGKSHTGPTEIWPADSGPPGKVVMRYDDGVEVHYELKDAPMGGGIFIGSECKLEINRNRFATNPDGYFSDAPSAAVAEAWEGPGWIARPHLKNWLDCMASRARPNADVEIGHRSVTVCHLINIAREVGRKLTWNPQTELFEGDEQANRLLDRPRRAGFELPVVS